MKVYIVFTRIEIDGHFKVAMRVYDKNVSINQLSITILDEVPIGLYIGIKYSNN